MAKKTKKSKEKPVEAAPVATTPESKTAPVAASRPAVFNDSQYSFLMSAEEVYSMVQILSFSKDIFAQMSLNYTNEGNQKAAAVFAARSELSKILYKKISDMASIGEPTSREIH
jgi:hypothetical protein